MTKKFISLDEAYNQLQAENPNKNPSIFMSLDDAYSQYHEPKKAPAAAPSKVKVEPATTPQPTGSSKMATIFDKIDARKAQYNPNLPDWSVGKAFSGGIGDVFSRIGAILGMNSEQIKSVANGDISKVVSNGTVPGGSFASEAGPGVGTSADNALTTVEKAAILRAKQGDQSMLNSLMAQRNKVQAGAEAAQKYFDPGQYNMPKTVMGQMVHDTVRSMPYTLGSMAYNLPIGLVTSGGSLMASLLGASPEAQMEQSDVYQEARKQGMSHEKAYALSQKDLAANMLLLPMSNYLQSQLATGVSSAVRGASEGKPLDTMLGRAVNRGMQNEAIKKFLTSDLTRDTAQTALEILGEGGEEVTQGAASQSALGRPIDKKELAYEGAVGGLMGALFSGGGIASDRLLNGRVNVKADNGKGSNTKAFMDNIANGIENGTLANEQKSAQPRSFVPNTQILNEMRNFYKEIASIPEDQRTAEDTDNYDQLRSILEMYTAGQEEEAEKRAKDLFDTSSLTKSQPSGPAMPMKDEYRPNTQIVPREQGGAVAAAPEGVNFDALNRVRDLAVADIRRLNGVDPASMTEADKYKYSMLESAFQALQNNDLNSTVNILNNLYGAAAMTEEQQSEPIAGRQFVNSELATTPGNMGAGAFSGQTAYEGAPQDVPTGGAVITKMDGSRVFVPEAELGNYYAYPAAPAGETVSRKQARQTESAAGFNIGDVLLADDGGWRWVSGVNSNKKGDVKDVTLVGEDGRKEKLSATVLQARMNANKLVKPTPANSESIARGMMLSPEEAENVNPQGPKYIEVPYPVRRKSQVAAEVSVMTKKQIRAKYGDEAAKAGSVSDAADAVVRQEIAQNPQLALGAGSRITALTSGAANAARPQTQTSAMVPATWNNALALATKQTAQPQNAAPAGEAVSAGRNSRELVRNKDGSVTQGNTTYIPGIDSSYGKEGLDYVSIAQKPKYKEDAKTVKKFIREHADKDGNIDMFYVLDEGGMYVVPAASPEDAYQKALDLDAESFRVTRHS